MYSPSESKGKYPQSVDKLHIDPFVRKQNAKLTQVIQNFFNKAVQIVVQARTLPDSSVSSVNKNEEVTNKINKWFNLQLYNHPEVPKEELKLWKSCTDPQAIPPMIIETYLDLRQLTSSQTLVLKDENGNDWTVAKGGGKKNEVVLERWLVEFDASNVSGSIVDELPLIYKQAIILFRSIYGFSRLMPAFKLKNRLVINKASSKLNKLVLGNHILDGQQPISSKGRIGLSKSIIPHQMLTTESHVSQKHFQPIQTTLGTLKVSIAYRNHDDFVIHDNEEVLSTHFISMDAPQGSLIESRESVRDSKTKFEEDYDDRKIPSIDEEISGGDAETPSQAIPTNHNREYPSSTAYKRLSNASMSVSPGSPGHRDKKSSTPVPQRPSIQPFKVGSISNSPPTSSNTPTNATGGGSLERRISITSNKSASNASLAAMLRNPRSSTSSTHSFANVPVSTSNSANTTMAVNINASSIPRSVSSSHGSNLQVDDGIFANIDGASNTPRFSSSFGSRASRRFSNTSVRQSSLTGQSGTGNDASILGTSTGSTTSSGAPLSGLYIDDDISDFVRMIDSKSDLRFSSFASAESKQLSPFNPQSSQTDPLNKFQMLRNQHQQLGDSVSASITLQNPGSGSGSGLGIVGSRNSSRKSSHSMYSPPGSLPSGSYEHSHSQLPSINSRLREKSPTNIADIRGISRSSSQEQEDVHSRKNSYSSSHQSNASFLKAPSNKLAAAPVTSTTSAHATIHGPVSPNTKTNTDSSKKSDVVTGLATTPSAYGKRAIHYENVFDDDDEEEDHHQSNDSGPNYYLSNTQSSVENSNSSGNRFHEHNHNQSHSHTQQQHNDDYDDDLLFTMSDMNLNKN